MMLFVLKMLVFSLVLCYGFTMVVAQKGRDGRFFSFNFEDRDITVDLDFSIPFLSIPVKKTANSIGIPELPTVNINPASLVLGGALVLTTTIILPLVMKHYVNTHSDYRLSRILDHTEFGADGVISFVNKMLDDGNGLRECTLKIACWTGHRRDEYLMNTVHRIASNKLISAFINSTSVEDAMLSGRSGRDCTSYKSCPIPEQYIPILLNNLTVLSKSYGI